MFTGSTVQEEAELITDLPKLPPFSSCHYAFPSYNSQYPEIQPPNKAIKLHLAGSTLESDESGKLFEGTLPWSQGIDLQSKYDVFVSVPDVADVKVHIEAVGYTTHVYIDAISRAEISAKEIRSRIKGKEVVKVEASVPRVKKPSRRRRTSDSSMAESEMTEATRLSTFDEKRSTLSKTYQRSAATPLSITCSCLCLKGNCVLVNESHDSSHIAELVRVSVEDVGLVYSPQYNVNTQTYRHAHRPQTLAIMLGDLQVDNQLYGKGNYDYPVVVLRQDVYTSPENKTGKNEMKYVLEHLSKECLAQVMIDLCCDFDYGGQTTIQNVDFQLKPLTVYIEDTFIYETLRVIDKVIPPPFAKQKIDHTIPKEIKQEAESLISPVRIKSISIAPIALLLSIHASLKLFIASDNTPLRFGKFERADLFTSGSQLSRAVTMHYASGALFRAGECQSSLNLLAPLNYYDIDLLFFVCITYYVSQ